MYPTCRVISAFVACCLVAGHCATPAAADTTIFNTMPFNLQNGTTADATQVMANFNQLIANGNANGAAAGSNTSITSLGGLTAPPSGNGSEVFYGTVVAGTANAITVGATYPGVFKLTAGNQIWIVPTLSNTAAATLNTLSTGVISIKKATVNGLVALAGGELIAGSPICLWYDGTQYIIMTLENFLDIPYVNITAAATTDLGTISGKKAQILGNATITSFGGTAASGSIFYLRFAGQSTLTQNAVSMILPGAANILTQPGDTAQALALGTSNWQVLRYDALPQNNILGTTPSASNLIIKNDAVSPTIKTNVTATSAVLTTSGLTQSLACANVNVTINFATTGINGVDTGTVAANVWYFVYIISNGTVCSGLASQSSTSPTLPSGYSYFVRVGAVSTDGTTALLRTRQAGFKAQYVIQSGTNTPSLPVLNNTATGNIATPVWTPIIVTGNGSCAPSTANAVRLLVSNPSGTTAVIMVAPNNQYGSYNNAFTPPPIVLNTQAVNMMQVMELESNSIFVANSANDILMCMGWEDSGVVN